MKHVFFSCYFSAFFFLAASSFSSSIQVEGRQLLVDGKPFVIKAVCYNPTPKGKNSSSSDPNALLTYKPNLTKEELGVIERDLKLMHEAGINTIRVYKPITNKDILKKLDFYNIKVIVPIFTSYKGHHHSKYVLKVQKIIEQLKKEKSTLFWEVGNEWNYNWFYTRNTDSAESAEQASSLEPVPEEEFAKCLKHLKRSIHRIREIDTTHPISTCLGDIPFKRRPDRTLDLNDLAIKSFWKRLPKQIDLYGINIYDGSSFSSEWEQDGERVKTRFERWKEITELPEKGGIGPKPLYISEYGATAYNLGKHGVPPFANYQELQQIVLTIDNFFLPTPLKGILPEIPLFIEQLSSGETFPVTINISPLDNEASSFKNPASLETQDHFGGVDELAQADAIDALTKEIQSNLSAKDPNNLLLGGAVFEFHDEWWKAPNWEKKTYDWLEKDMLKDGILVTDSSVHSIRGFATTDCRNKNMVCGGPSPDGYFHEEWFGLLTLDRIPRPAYYKLKEIYTAIDDNGLPKATSTIQTK